MGDIIYQNTAQLFHQCDENSYNFSYFAIQVDMTIYRNAQGGFVFRANPSTGQMYVLTIDTSDGYYNFYMCSGYGENKCSHDIRHGSSSALISSGSIEVTLIAYGDTFYLYVGERFIDSGTDTSLSSGRVGLLSSCPQTPPAGVLYSNVKVWAP